MQEKLSQKALNIFATLKTQLNSSETFVLSEFNVAQLAEKLNIQLRTVQRLTNKLENAGLIKILKSSGGSSVILVKTTNKTSFQQNQASKALVGTPLEKLFKTGFLSQNFAGIPRFKMFFEKYKQTSKELEKFIDKFLLKAPNYKIRNKYDYFTKSWFNWHRKQSQTTPPPKPIKRSFNPTWLEKAIAELN